MPRTHRNHTSSITHTSIAITLALSTYSHPTQTTSQSSQPPHPPHRVPRQPHRHTMDDHRTTPTTKAHIPSSKSERNLIGIRNKLEELKLLIHNTHAYMITIQDTKPTPKAKLQKYITLPPCEPIGHTW